MKLLITDSTYRSRELQLSSSASIGRSADNTIQIEDIGLGRNHAVIDRRRDGDWLRDLGSTNGTFVNGARVVMEHCLQRGDVITLGSAATIQVLETHAQTFSAISPATYVPTNAGRKSGDKLSTPYLVLAGVVVILVLTISGVVIRQIIKPKRPSFSRDASLGQMSSPVKATTPPVRASETPKPSVGATAAPVDKVPFLVSGLASQLSSKPLTYYRFDPAMLAEIKRLTGEYQINVTPQAQEAKQDIVRAFSVAHGLKPLFGFVLAMSRSKFQLSRSSQEIGYWRVPVMTAQEFAPGESLTTLNQPAQAANLAAQYLLEARSIFPADEDFMYAIACYGVPREKAGDLYSKLNQVTEEERRDFWKMVTAQIVPSDGADQVLRFFAAGIVGDNPHVFHLPEAKAFSAL